MSGVRHQGGQTCDMHVVFPPAAEDGKTLQELLKRKVQMTVAVQGVNYQINLRLISFEEHNSLEFSDNLF